MESLILILVFGSGVFVGVIAGVILTMSVRGES